jgi:hypothetical protein
MPKLSDTAVCPLWPDSNNIGKKQFFSSESIAHLVRLRFSGLLSENEQSSWGSF